MNETSESTTDESNDKSSDKISDQAIAAATNVEATAELPVIPDNEKPDNEKRNPDFLDIEVSEARAAFIRTQVQNLRELEVMENFRILAKELGEEALDTDEDGNTQLPGFSKKGDQPLVFSAPSDHPSEGLQIALQNTDLKLLYNQDVVLELSFLPKDNEYVVFYMNENRIEDLKTWIESLNDFVVAAKAKKTERKTKWQSRFKKN